MKKRVKSRVVLLTVPLVVMSSVPRLAATAEAEPFCTPQYDKGPVLVNEQCVDPIFNRPVIDTEKQIVTPVPLHQISGHFEGTKVTFNFYFPPKSQWQGRFFHHLYPYTSGVPDNDTLRFGAESGAYIVKTGTSSGYRADAAAAKYSRHIAREYYGVKERHIFGYVYGGSGGSYQTIAAAENSSNVWDGAVPYVIGAPTSIPANFFARAFARLVLKDVATEISDAFSPGGNNNPYLKLDDVQQQVLREITKLGVPQRGWDNPAYLLGLESDDGLMGFQANVKNMDPSYAADFWSKPGYLGTAESPLGTYIRQARLRETIKVVRADPDIRTLKLEHIPSASFVQGAEYTLYDDKGRALGTTTGYLKEPFNEVLLSPDTPDVVLKNLLKAASVHIDNSWILALTTYHRHQTPAGSGFYAWDQFRFKNGEAVYPQRPTEIGPAISNGASGGGQFTGKYTGKMIVLGNLLDMDAYPWQGDWYAQRVKSASESRYNDSFRIWINDNADHHDGSVIVSGRSDNGKLRLVSYVGILQQTLRDVSAWAEKGIAPSPSTRYRVMDGQINFTADPAARGGIQPAVELSANGLKAVNVEPGQAVILDGIITVPAGTGSITLVEWSKTGSKDTQPGTYMRKGAKLVTTSPAFVYDRPGTYFPVLRVTLHRDGNAESPVAVVQNIDRIRIVVREKSSPGTQ